MTTKKFYALEDFEMQKVEKSDGGSWDTYDHKWSINYSSVLTKLIQEAGRWCESHADDLFISWKYIERNFKNSNYLGGKYVFGFRKSGVDHAEYVMHNLEEYGVSYCENYYRAIWVLEISVEGNFPYGIMWMKLGKMK